MPVFQWNPYAPGGGSQVTTPRSQQELVNEWLAAMQAFENSPYGQRQAQQQQSANATLYTNAQTALNNQSRELSANIRNAKERLKLEARQLAITKGQAEADKWYKEQSIQLQQQQFAEGQRQFNLGQGFEALKYGSSLAANPRSMFEAMYYNAGTQGNPNVSANIANWANAFGGQQPYVGGFTGTPRTGSIADAAAQMTGSGGVGSQAAGTAPGADAAPGLGSPAVQSTLASLKAWGMNPQQGAPGFWEGKDEDEQAAIMSGLAASGFNPAGVIAKYRKSRLPGQVVSASAA
jgi:hypothetical protein